MRGKKHPAKNHRLLYIGVSMRSDLRQNGTALRAKTGASKQASEGKEFQLQGSGRGACTRLY